MNKRYRSDLIFKEKLSAKEVAPPDHIWENIVSNLNESKKKSTINPFWFSFFCLIGAFSLLFAFHFLKPATDINAYPGNGEEGKTPIQKLESNQGPAPGDQASVDHVAESMEGKTESNSAGIAPTTGGRSIDPGNNTSKAHENANSVNSKETLNGTIRTTTTKGITPEKADASSRNPDTDLSSTSKSLKIDKLNSSVKSFKRQNTKDQEAKNNKSIKSGFDHANSGGKVNTDINNRSLDLSSTGKTDDNLTGNENTPSFGVKNGVVNNGNSTSFRYSGEGVDKIDMLPFYGIAVKNNYTLDKDHLNEQTLKYNQRIQNYCNIKERKKIKPVKTNRNASYFLDALYSPDIAMKQLVTSNSDYDQYADWRRGTEHSMYAYTSGLRGSVVFKPGVSIRTGLMYSQINEQFKHTQYNYRWDIDKVTYNTELGKMDTTYKFVDGKQTFENKNKYQSLDIPVTFGFELYKKKFTLSFNMGASINLLFSQKGMMLNQAGIPFEFGAGMASDSDNPYENRIGVSVIGSCGFDYYLSNKFSLIVEPHFKYMIRSVTKPSYPIQQNYMVVGLMTGVRYRF